MIKRKMIFVFSAGIIFFSCTTTHHEILPFDAVKSYLSILSIVVIIIGQDVENRRIKMNPKILKYLKKSGVYEPSNE